MVRNMTIADYEQVYALWMQIKGFAMRSVDDSKEGVAGFLKRNPKTSVVAIEDDKVVGAILCGHDGRRGCMYHVCVHPDYRRRGIGKEMVVYAMKRLQEEGISKVSLIAFTSSSTPYSTASSYSMKSVVISPVSESITIIPMRLKYSPV